MDESSVTGRVSGGQQCNRTGKWRTAVYQDGYVEDSSVTGRINEDSSVTGRVSGGQQ